MYIYIYTYIYIRRYIYIYVYVPKRFLPLDTARDTMHLQGMEKAITE